MSAQNEKLKVKANIRKTTPVKIINTGEDSFLDFGNLGFGTTAVVPEVVDVAPNRPASTKASRFATVANADVVNIKRIHDGLVLGEMTEAIGTDATQCPKFYAMDFARTVNRVLASLNLRPTDDEPPYQMYDPNSKSIPELHSTIHIQQELLNELGKNLDYLQKYNAQLVQLNKTLVQERTVAYQSRDDLHQLLLKEKEKALQKKEELNKAKEEKNKSEPHSRERMFFNETAILDEAFTEFKKRYLAKEVSKEAPVIVEAKESVQAIENITFDSAKSKIQYVADLLATQKQYEPPSTLSLRPNQSREQNFVRVGKPKTIQSGIYHPPQFQKLTERLSNYISLLSSIDVQRNKELMESDSMEQYVELIHARMREISTALGDCLNVLAEEQRCSRQWKLKCVKLEKNYDILFQAFERIKKNQGSKISPQELIPNPAHERTVPKFPVVEDISKYIQLREGNPAYIQKNSTKIYIPSMRLAMPYKSKQVPALPAKTQA